MSSGFVSGGTADAPIERNEEWLLAQQELEANRRRKAEQERQTGGRSLFETLEANKAAKQEAFEEANRLKNQFRSLDADEIEFLDSVLESTRAEEQRVKKETAEGLEAFRRQQDAADKKLLARRGSDVAQGVDGVPAEEEEQWVAGGRKRKRAKEKEGLKGVKRRKSSTSDLPVPVIAGSKVSDAVATPTKPDASTSSSVQPSDQQTPKPTKPATTSDLTAKKTSSSTSKEATVTKPPASKGGLGLVDYGSDEDDD